jgi:diguanylate cyclase (GGDEF)-like protein
VRISLTFIHARNQLSLPGMRIEFRKLHRKLAPIVFFPLLASAITGFLYSAVRGWSPPGWITSNLMKVHQGEYLGKPLVPIYVLLVGLGLIGMSFTGLSLLDRRANSNSAESSILGSRSLHRWLGLILLLPLAVSAETGVTYRLGKDWFNMSNEQAEVFLKIHQGAYLGSAFSVVYLSLLGVGLVVLLVAGISMTSLVKIPSLPKIKLPQRQPQRSVSAIASQTSELEEQQQDIVTILDENEVKSHTILKAIPDSMLCMRQDGTCLNYIPAKGSKTFLFDGDILDKHVSEFLPPDVAQALIECARLAIESGLTQTYQFSSVLNDKKRHQEARVSSIGETDVLIIMRDLPASKPIKTEPQKSPPSSSDRSVILTNQKELVELLKVTLENTKNHDRRNVLCYFAIDRYDTIDNQFGAQASDSLLHQVAVRARSHLPSTSIMARLDNNEIALLLLDYSLEKASMLVSKLRQGISKCIFFWQGKEYPISISIGLVEINPNSSDAASIMNAADAACKIAKQKITSKAFW